MRMVGKLNYARISARKRKVLTSSSVMQSNGEEIAPAFNTIKRSSEYSTLRQVQHTFALYFKDP